MQETKNTVVSFLKQNTVGRAIYSTAMHLPPLLDYCSKLDAGNTYDGATATFKQHETGIQSIINLLADDASRRSYLAAIHAMSQKSGNPLRRNACPPKKQYFDPTIPLPPSAYARFVDCGAYTGDTISALCAHFGADSIQALYAFEPDAVNVAALIELCKCSKIDRFSVYPIAVWDKQEQLCFQQSGTAASRISSAGEQVVSADALDHVLADHAVTFLKMDIEGAELRALQGATQLIQAQQPVLAICLYHSPEDLALIPQFIVSICPNYRLYVRHYSKALFGEVVCYAIPERYFAH